MPVFFEPTRADKERKKSEAEKAKEAAEKARKKAEREKTRKNSEREKARKDIVARVMERGFEIPQVPGDWELMAVMASMALQGESMVLLEEKAREKLGRPQRRIQTPRTGGATASAEPRQAEAQAAEGQTRGTGEIGPPPAEDARRPNGESHLPFLEQFSQG